MSDSQIWLQSPMRPHRSIQLRGRLASRIPRSSITRIRAQVYRATMAAAHKMASTDTGLKADLILHMNLFKFLALEMFWGKALLLWLQFGGLFKMEFGLILYHSIARSILYRKSFGHKAI